MIGRGVKQRRKIVILILIIFSLITPLAYSHPGRTDSNGCHYCRTNCEESWGIPYGFYHRHNPVRACFEETITTSPPTTTPAPTTTAPPTTTPAPTTTTPPTTTPTPTTTLPPTTTPTPTTTTPALTTPAPTTTAPPTTIPPTTIPPLTSNVSEPILNESGWINNLSNDTEAELENGACGPSAIILLVMLPLGGLGLLRRKI